MEQQSSSESPSIENLVELFKQMYLVLTRPIIV